AGGNTEQLRRERDALPVIARRRGHHAVRTAALIHLHERVERTADLERPRLLQIFELEIDLTARETRERVRFLSWRAADVRADGRGSCRDRGCFRCFCGHYQDAAAQRARARVLPDAFLRGGGSRRSRDTRCSPATAASESAD